MSERESWQKCTRAATLLAVVALVIGLGCSTVYRAAYSPTHRSDFTVYTAAGKAVLDGTNIYEAYNVRGWYYMYLPVFAVVMVPFALMNTFSASLIWYLLSVVMVAYGIDLAARLALQCFSLCRINAFWLRALTLLVVLLPALSGMARGQASVLIMVLTTLGVWFYFQKRPWKAGLALAGAIVMKIFPALLVLYFLVQRRFKFAAATAVWLLILVVVLPSAVFGPSGNVALLRQWTMTIALPANRGTASAGASERFDQMINPRNMRNQSVRAVAIRSASGRVLDVPAENEEIARPLSTAINLALLLVSTWVCFRNRASDSPRRSLLKICAVILLMLMMSPVSWNHNFVLVVLPAAVAVAAWQSAQADPSHVVLGRALLVYVTGNLLSLIDWFNFYGSTFWGTIFLWGGFIWVLLKEKKAGQQPSGDGNAGGSSRVECATP